MPYRGRRTGTYYRRRRQAPTTWVRHDYSYTSRLTPSQILCIDLLAPLHTAEAILKIAGAYTNAPSTTGKTVLRVHGQIFSRWNATAGTGPDFTDGFFVGIQVVPWAYDQVHKVFDATQVPAGVESPRIDPIQAANTADWSYWQNVRAAEQNTTWFGTASPWTGNLMTRFDQRARRSMRELGESLVMSIRPDGPGTAGVESLEITTSTLLR